MLVSMIIVALNARAHIERALTSFVSQGIDPENYEIIYIDSMSNDGTDLIAEKYLERNVKNFKSLKNPHGTLSAGWNLAIEASSGDYIIRIDAHSTIEKDYVKKACTYLSRDASTIGVGGIIENISSTPIGKYISIILSNPLGVGPSKFRVGIKNAEFTDTIVYGLYKRSIFEKVKSFDESMNRNQDLKFHRSIIESGFKLLTANELKATYYTRDTLSSFLKQAFKNGFWITYGLEGRIRHIVPMLFFTFNCGAIIYSRPFLSVVLGIYFILLSISYAKKSRIRNPLKLIVLDLMSYFLHMTYGVGSFVGLIARIGKIREKNI
jgi:glycosyltransferase involved in cell wall biosynthesis